LPPAARKLHAAIRTKALAALTDAGHQVDSLDLYAEKFDPVLSEEGYVLYHLNVVTEGQRAAFGAAFSNSVAKNERRQFSEAGDFIFRLKRATTFGLAITIRRPAAGQPTTFRKQNVGLGVADHQHLLSL
jgi:hypothetical protein